MNSNLFRYGLLIVSAVSCLGCSNGKIIPPSTVPVSGVVLLKGKPAPGIRVTFHPQFDIGKIKYQPQGQTDIDGKFVLSTGAPFNGAPLGDYAVTFEKPEIESAKKSNYIETEIDAFQGKYNDPSQSRWKITVKRNEPQLQPFELD